MLFEPHTIFGCNTFDWPPGHIFFATIFEVHHPGVIIASMMVQEVAHNHRTRRLCDGKYYNIDRMSSFAGKVEQP